MKRGAGLPGCELVLYRFTGRFEVQDGVVFATCDQLPIATSGTTQEAAMESMNVSIDSYKAMMEKRGEWKLAVQQFSIPEFRIQLGSPESFGWMHKVAFGPSPTFERLVPNTPVYA